MEHFVQEKRDLLNTFEERAKDWVWFLNKYHVHRSINGNPQYDPNEQGNSMDFYWIDKPEDCTWYTKPRFIMVEVNGVKHEAIEFRPNSYATIHFYAIRSKAGAKMDWEESNVDVLDPKIVDVQTRSSSNSLSSTVKRSLQFKRVKTEQTQSEQELGWKVAVEVASKISVGGDVYGAKAEASMKASAGVSGGTSTSAMQSSGSENTDSFEVEIKPHTKLTATRTVKRARTRKTLTFKGELDWSVGLLSDRDFEIHFDAQRDVQEVLSGVAPAWGGDPKNDWPTQFNQHPIDECVQYDRHHNWQGGQGLIDRLTDPIFMTKTVTDEFDGAIDAETDLQEEAL